MRDRLTSRVARLDSEGVDEEVEEDRVSPRGPAPSLQSGCLAVPIRRRKLVVEKAVLTWGQSLRLQTSREH